MISRTRRLIDLETHRAVFTWILQLLAAAGLVKGRGATRRSQTQSWLVAAQVTLALILLAGAALLGDTVIRLRHAATWIRC